MRRILAVAICVTGALAPALAQEGDVDAGAAAYEENCATCHGERLRATGAAPDLKLLGEDQRAKFETTVEQGKGQMPPWGGVLSDDETRRDLGLHQVARAVAQSFLVIAVQVHSSADRNLLPLAGRTTRAKPERGGGHNCERSEAIHLWLSQ